MILEIDDAGAIDVFNLISAAQNADGAARLPADVLERLSGVMAQIIEGLPGGDGGGPRIDFSDAAQPVDENHLRFVETVRAHAPELLQVVTPAEGDDLPPGALVSEVEPFALLRVVHFSLAAMVEALDSDAATNPAIAAKWVERRERFLNGEGEVALNFLRYFPRFVGHAFYVSLVVGMICAARDQFDDDPAEADSVAVGFMQSADLPGLMSREIKSIIEYTSGRRHKQKTPEGSPLVVKVWSYMMGATRRNSIDGRLIYPHVKKIVEELNRDPEFSQAKRRVVKGGSKRRAWTDKSLYEELRRAKSSLTKIKKEVASSFG